MKLSELFQIAIEALDEDAQQELSFIAYPRHETRYDERKQSAEALRAIAPALVELVAADHACELMENADDFETADNMDALQAANQRLINASRAIHAALKEAGVSCE